MICNGSFNHQYNAANLNKSKSQFQLELSLAQFSPSLFSFFTYSLTNKDWIDLKPGCQFELDHCLNVYKKRWPILTLKGPCRALYVQGSPKIIFFLLSNQNKTYYSFGIKYWIDPQPGSKLEFVHCLNVYKRNNPSRPFFRNSPLERVTFLLPNKHIYL